MQHTPDPFSMGNMALTMTFLNDIMNTKKDNKCSKYISWFEKCTGFFLGSILHTLRLEL